MSGSIFVFAETPTAAAELVTLARDLNRSCRIVACGCPDPEIYADCGADGVLSLGGGLAVSYAKALAALMKERGAEILLASNTGIGRELAAATAGFLDCAMVSDAQTMEFVEDTLEIEHLIYGGAVVARERCPLPCVATFGAGRRRAAVGSCPVEWITCQPDERITLVSEAPIEKKGVDLREAERVVGAGMGFGTEEELQTAAALAEALGAALGCSRSLAEDKHWFDEYIGLSGVQISPKLYFALGISGQVQHLVGARGAQLIVAVNRDENAPIMHECDYGIVGDMFRIVPLLIKEITG